MEIFDNLAHQIVLLSVNPHSGEVRNPYRLRVLATAGVLAELALQERIRFADGKVEVSDPRPLDDPMPDVMLDDLSHRPWRAPIRIVADPKDHYLNQTLAELVTNRRLRMTPTFATRTSRYEILDAAVVEQARGEAAAALSNPAECSQRRAYLGALAAHMGLTKELAPEIPLRQRMGLKTAFEQRLWLMAAVGDVFRMSARMERI